MKGVQWQHEKLAILFNTFQQEHVVYPVTFGEGGM